MTPIDLLKPSPALGAAAPETACAAAPQHTGGPLDAVADELTRTMLMETLSSMLSASASGESGEEPAADPMAAVIGMLLDSTTKASVI